MARLEGLFEAAEVKDTKLIDEWYKKWMPLEEINGFYSGSGKEPSFEEMQKDLEDFLKFLKGCLKEGVD